MIKIIKGSYGLNTGITVKPISSKDGPISLPPETEARLVRIGVAEYVGEPPAAAPAVPAQAISPQPASDADDTVAPDTPAYSMEMTRAQLEEYAEFLGVDVSKAKNKAEIIQALEETTTDREAAEEDDGEDLPTIDAADPV